MASLVDRPAAKATTRNPKDETVIVIDDIERDNVYHSDSDVSDGASSSKCTRSKTTEIGHGAFSSCLCPKCMASAKREVEKRLPDETLTTNYIKKLEELVLTLKPRERYDFNSDSDSDSDTYGGGAFNVYPGLPPPPPPPSFFPHSGPSYKPKKEKSKLGWKSLGKADASDNDDVGPKVDIKRKRKVHQQYGEAKIEADHDKFFGADDIVINARNESVLTVIREYDMKKNFWRKSIEILSPEFVQTLTEVSPSQVDLPPLSDGFLKLSEPLMSLFWSRKHLTDFVEKDSIANPDKNKRAKEHTRLVLGWMKNENGEVGKKFDDLESKDPSGLIEFADLWMLYAPGTVVFTKEQGEWEALVIDSVRGCQKSVRRRSGQYDYTRLDLTCWAIDYDGEVFGRVWTCHCITPFQNKKDIKTLNLIPEQFLPDADAVKQALRTRGKAFWGLQGQNYKEYTGEMYSQRTAEGATRVVVDHLTYQRRENWPIAINGKKGPDAAVSKNWRDDRFNHNSNIRSRRGRNYNDIQYNQNNRMRAPPPVYVDIRNSCSPDGEYFDPPPVDQVNCYTVYPADRPPQNDKDVYAHYEVIKPEDTPEEFALMLCPQAVHGFCLRDKIWKDLNVSQLRDVAFRKDAWNRLVLDSEYKDIVTALVSSYSSQTSRLNDLVAGKGAGLVALMHGPPGTGKTLTAECVAESFEKPLYQVTCGDIGTSATNLENRLEEIFDYATTWGAILLLDEADVFLQDRDHSHLERNALVSIFLRTLEYFNGILFLTTNRVGMFDQAFQSRVHVTLGLPALDTPGREAVWSIFLDDLRSESAITSGQHSDLMGLVKTSWAKKGLNGRQIRNAVRTAMVVAEKKGEVLGRGHFETVLRLGGVFEGYMRALKGSEGEVAERRGERLAEEEGVVVV